VPLKAAEDEEQSTQAFLQLIILPITKKGKIMFFNLFLD